MTTGDKFNKVLESIHDGFWEYNLQGKPFDFPPEALRNATKIFMDVIMDRMWKRMKAEGFTQEISGRMAEDCGKEMRELIKKYTLVDMPDFYKKDL